MSAAAVASMPAVSAKDASSARVILRCLANARIRWDASRAWHLAIYEDEPEDIPMGPLAFAATRQSVTVATSSLIANEAIDGQRLWLLHSSSESVPRRVVAHRAQGMGLVELFLEEASHDPLAPD